MCVRVCVNVRISVTMLMGVRCPDVDEITTVRGPSKPQSSCRSKPSAGQGPGALGAGSRENALPVGRALPLGRGENLAAPSPGRQRPCNRCSSPESRLPTTRNNRTAQKERGEYPRPARYQHIVLEQRWGRA